MIVDEAMKDDSVKDGIFGGFHCIHCGSVNPEDWISNRKGKKDASVTNLSISISILSSPSSFSSAHQPTTS
jgi:hypothetical protein